MREGGKNQAFISEGCAGLTPEDLTESRQVRILSIIYLKVWQLLLAEKFSLFVINLNT